MLDAAITYVLSKAASYDLQSAMRWLTGSLNGATWSAVLPLALASLLLVPALLSRGRDLNVHAPRRRLGGQPRGAPSGHARDRSIVAAVALLAFATAATGPIAFVAFMAGPIAARIVGPGGSLLLPSALVGALLVQLADLLGQFAFDSRYPVGVVTGVLGAPFLIYLLIKTNRAGGSL